MKYLKYNFLPGREFVDVMDLSEQLTEWNITIADVRVHGTTHERPIDRLQAERAYLVQTTGHPPFAHEGRYSRIVASDYLVSFQTNYYSVPFQLMGHTVEVQATQEQVRIYHRGQTVAEHPRLSGQHQLRILPEHGPGAIARNTRQRYGLAGRTTDPVSYEEVEIRDLACYEQLLTAPAAVEVIP